MNRVAYVVISFHALSLGDGWLGADKAKHFFLGAFVQSAAFSSMRAAGVSREGSLAAASGVTTLAVVAKEVRDLSGKGTPSVKDVVWGLAGAAAVSPALMKAK